MVWIKSPIKETDFEKLNISFINRGKKRYKNFLGRLMGDLAKARNDRNKEMETYLTELISSYNLYERKAVVEMEGWKGKSGIRVINKIDSFDVITYQKRDQEAEPKEIITNIPKQQVNLLIKSLNCSSRHLNFKENIPTREIAKDYCKIANLYVNSHNKLLFENNEEFNWDNFFSDRPTHILFNLTLRLLDYYKIILYRGGYTSILKEVMDIQEALKKFA